MDTLPRVFLNTLRLYPKENFMLVKKAGIYHPLSTAAFGKQVRHFALGLRELGVFPEDKVVLLSENRPEWVMADLGVVWLRGITVPIYTTLIPEQIKFIIQNSDAKVVVCSDLELWEKIESVRSELPQVQHFILFAKDPPEGALSLEEVWAAGRKRDTQEPELFGRLAEEVEAGDVATLIYTSGTTGVPKGAMLTHANLISNAEAVLSIIEFTHRDTVLSFLPLSHILERWATCCYLYVGATIGYAESIDTLSENMLEIRPTVMVTVPRLLERIYARVLDSVLEGSLLKRAVFHWAVKVGRRYAQRIIRQRPVSPFLKAQRRIAHKLVFAKIYARTGGRLRFFVSGGAPLSKEIGEFFYALGLLAVEGYGLTETSPVISCNRPDELKFGSVGKPIPGVEVKIAEDGEILARGPNIMWGYYKNEAATAEAFEEDWFKTGDVGRFDEEGFLVITDRKKDIIVTSGGKNVAPQPIENTLKATRYILNAVLVGDRRKFVSALIVPDFEKLEAYAGREGIAFSSRAELVENQRIQDFMQQQVEAASAGFSRYEKVKRIVLLDRDFEIEKGEITPSLKVKRHKIEQKYASRIDALYRE